MRKIGLLFGSFNPVHNGHVLFAKSALAETDCNEIWLVVQANNPYKQQEDLAPLADRVEMCKLAFRQIKSVQIISTTRPHVAHTIQDLQQKYPEDEFVILLGQDVALSLPVWPDYRQITANFTVYYHPRPGFHLPQSEHIIAIEAEELELSSTDVRKQAQAAGSLTNLVPRAVAEYIDQQELYRAS